MTDPVLETVAELIFADLLVDIHELEVLANSPWFSAYCQAKGLDRNAVEARLMVAHHDPVVDHAAIRQMFPDDQEELLDLLADISAIDGHPDPREIAVIECLAKDLNRTSTTTEIRLSAAIERTRTLRERLNQPLPTSSPWIGLLRTCDRIFGQERVDRAAAMVHQEHRIRNWRRFSFFNHQAYRASLVRMQQLTAKLMPQTLRALEVASSNLAQLREGFAGITTGLIAGYLPPDSQQQLQELLDKVRNDLDHLVQDDLTRLHHDLQAKQRSFRRFCIATVGRTKAGKTTLITTLTGRDQAAIGDGTQGFTRYNRAYDFYGMRLIDTPGIGAVGGQGKDFKQAEIRDSDVAKSIFPETDLVCFVMDNDANVPCTWEMMSDLHARGKAFLILLNVKASMQGGLDLFCSRLDALFAKEGEQSISGNIAAIRRDLASCIGIQSARAVPIIPIHAKANLKYREIKEPVEAEQWRQLSRIDHFLEQLDNLITRQAPELRRQTLRKNPRLELDSITSKLKELQRQLDLQAKVFGDTKVSAEKQVREIFAELQPAVHEGVAELFAPLELAAQRFSSQHFKKNAKQLECLWREEIERADLPAHVKDLVNWLKAELAERLQKLQEYIQERLKFQAQTLTLNIEIRLEFSFDIDFDEAIRRNVNLGFKILAGVLGFVGLFTGGTVLLILPVVIAFLPDVFDWLIPGADKQKAQQALKQELLKTLNEPKAKLAEQLEQLLREQCDELASAITQGLGGSEAALLAFSSQIERCSSQIERQAQTLS